MTTLKTDIVHTVDPPVEGPSTHAIVIGIGSYPHGRDGTTKSQVADLASPVHSAKAVADWLVTGFDNPMRPLATVSLIVSDAIPYEYTNPKTGIRYEVPRGTSADVEQSVRQWVSRSAASPHNGCIFYFCGHGVRSGQRDAVLTRSFGEDPYNSLIGIFDRASLQSGLSMLGPEHQILMFDACRKNDPIMFDGNDNLTNFLRPAIASADLGVVTQSRLFAAAEGFEAYGRLGGPSLFVSEFLKACNYASESDDGWWTESVAVQRHIARAVGEQQCQHEGMSSRVSRISGEPLVPVVVYANPKAHIGRMRIACISKAGDQWNFDGSAELEPTEWRLDLFNQVYDFTATACWVDDFQTFNNSEVMIYPPFRRIMVDVEQGMFK